MSEKVELVFKRVKTTEKPKDLIIRYFSTQFRGKEEDYEIHPEGKIISDIVKIEERVYGVYHKTFYLTDKRLIIIRPNGGVHILEFWEIDREFFTSSKYPAPGHLWELLELLKWQSLKGYRFTGPPQVRQFVKNPSSKLRDEFQLKPHPFIWQAVICCKCNCDIFRIQTLGKANSEGLLHDTEEELQRVELSCQDCDQNILLFDPTLHGYNATIDEYKPISLSPRQAKHPFQCQCGNNKFQVALSVVYDPDPEILADFTTKERNNSYGWFYAFLKCPACKRLITFIDYECA